MADKDRRQVAKFKEVARELGCDKSETAFTETLKRIGKHKPIVRSYIQSGKGKRRKDQSRKDG